MPRRCTITHAFHAALFAGVALLACPHVEAGDILRGGASAASRQNAGTTAASGVVTQSGGSNPASDTLAKTTQTIQSMRNLQNAVRAAFANGGANNLGADPNHPWQQLPNVPNGLRTGGLVPDSGLSTQGIANPVITWSGANTPTEQANGSLVTVNIKQTAQQALLNWQTFNIGSKTTLNIDQSAGGSRVSQWIAFNLINDPSGIPSQILGSIQAQGQVYVINQNGIIFGAGSQVNTHALVASSLPINTNLVSRGLLNNPDDQYLFSSLAIASGSNGTPAFTPSAPNTPNGRNGDITVQQGAVISSPTTSDHVGGRVVLVAPNVTDNGEISTPDGQTILAAGNQVGFAAHPSTDASLRGLDVYVGAVDDYSGNATNAGVIEADRGDVTITGRNVNQNGAIVATTSVSLNGRIDLLANYNAVSSGGAANSNPFLPQSTGVVTLGDGSVTEILPELSSADTVVGSALSLQSQVNIQGLAIHFAGSATLLAPSANVSLNAGLWDYDPSIPLDQFIYTGGQIYMDAGSTIDVAGSQNVSASVSENIVSAQLRGAELANSPLQRDGVLRGATVQVDILQTGVYNGTTWVGTPLADVSGYANLVQHTVGELTTNGGTVIMNAGNSVVVQNGAIINVSGGSINYQGAMVQTTKLLSGGHIYDISQATPDLVYDGVLNGFTQTYSRWGVTETFATPLLGGAYYEAGYVQGGKGGAITITAPSMALDGNLYGQTVSGARQQAVAPAYSSLSLIFQAQDPVSLNNYSPLPPAIIFQSGSTLAVADAFALDSSGSPLELRSDRESTVLLDPSLVNSRGFENLTITNGDGDVTVPANVTIQAQAGGSITVSAANIDIEGKVIAPGGALNFTAYDVTLTPLDSPAATPAADPTRGNFTLGSNAALVTSGLILDDRPNSPTAFTQLLVTNGGTVAIKAYNETLSAGSLIDVSGGAAVSANGKLNYGKAGSITLKAGQDPKIASVLGGELTLGATLRGYGAKSGGALSITAPAIQIGGTTANSDVLFLSPVFFNQGGFSSYNLAGLGIAVNGQPDEFVLGILVAPGVMIKPTAVSSVFALTGDGVSVSSQLSPEGVRPATSIALVAAGVIDPFSGLNVVRGDAVIDTGAVIITDGGAGVSVSGNTVAVRGSIIAPGGLITIAGGANSNAYYGSLGQEVPTVEIAAGSLISAVGKYIPLADSTGHHYRTGTVLAGGTISVSGNIVAEQGAVLDVSGASAVLDLPAASSGQGSTAVQSPGQTDVIATRVNSNGGVIILAGGQMLFTDATLKGNAGGPSAAGGSLTVSSGRFDASSASPLDPTLIVTQSGPALPASYYAQPHGVGDVVIPASIGGTANYVTDGNGNPLYAVDGLGNPVYGLGHFAADSFNLGGFDSLSLQGTVLFEGAVNIQARKSVNVATAGVAYANSNVHITAPYVALGMAFQPPVQSQLVNTPYFQGSTPFYFSPVYGAGSLNVRAAQIDMGYLSLQGIGAVNLDASNGDIRGDGILDVAGVVTLKAAQIYPPTETTFTIAAHDYQSGGTQPGTVIVIKAGNHNLPLSGGGTLNIYASQIEQNGVLRAPFGAINLGWDGAGGAPVDIITNQAVPVANTVTLGVQSITSVSGIDPLTGQGIEVPYGIELNGTQWIDPSGADITAGGAPSKSIHIAGANIVNEAGSTIDLRGGGDLIAYRFVSGTGGGTDILSSSTSFAVIPGYGSDYAPYGAFSTNPDSNNLGGDLGYVNSTLSPGDKVYLAASNGLPAGVYTLLPARYALLSGAYLVTPQSGNAPAVSVTLADGSSIVPGYRTNVAQSSAPLYTAFEVDSRAVINARAEYDFYSAYSELKKDALSNNVSVPRLPVDSGQLVFSATQNMVLGGAILSQAPTGGLGGELDISSPLDILIAGPGHAAVSGELVLDSTQLSGFQVQSILIGGERQTGTAGTTISVTTNNVTIDNAGAPLSGQDIVLVARQNLNVAAGAQISVSATGAATADTFTLGNSNTAGSGDGALLRVSNAVSAPIIRQGVDASTIPNLTIGAGVTLSGESLVIDSTSSATIDPTAVLQGNSVYLDSGHISLVLDNPGALQSLPGLVISGDALQTLQSSAQNLSFLSYSALDIYGTGTIGGVVLQNLSLHAAEIRGFNGNDGAVLVAAKTITLDNSASGASSGTAAGASGSLIFNADTITIGANTTRVDQYSTVQLNATGGLLASGSGGLSAAADLKITAPIIAVGGASNENIIAGGALTMDLPSGTAAVAVSGGLGGTLLLQGTSVTVNNTIQARSGQITVHTTSGNVSVDGMIDAAGSARQFFDVTQYTDGGTVYLTSDAGSVIIAPGGGVSVAAQPGAGSAGSVVVSATSGGFVFQGATLSGSGGSGGKNGSFSLDAASLPDSGALNAVLNDAAFTQSRSLRVRTGDVVVSGTSTTANFSLSADAGSILLTGLIDASGSTGGSVSLVANGSVTLSNNSGITVKGANFDDAGKGGVVYLEAGSETGGNFTNVVLGAGPQVDIQAGSVIDLSVASVDDIAGSSARAAAIAQAAANGEFTGVLHIRAPQSLGNTDVQVRPINGSIVNASSITIEGYQVYKPVAGDIDGVEGQILANGKQFVGANGSAAPGYNTMLDRLFANNAGLESTAIIEPGAEIITTKSALAALPVSLNTSGTSAVTVPAGIAVTFPSGTPGTDKIKFSVAGTITVNGVTTSFAANTVTTLAAGSVVTLNSQGTITFSAGTSGAIPLTLPTYTSFTTTGVTAITPSGNGNVTQLNAVNAAMTFTAGTTLVFPTGTPGTGTTIDKVKFSSAGTITTPSGVTTSFAANTTTTLVAGSTVKLTSGGVVTFASGSGGAIPIAVPAAAVFTTSAGTSTISTTTSDLTLYSNWDLSTFKFGPNSAAGVLTLRASGNVVFNFKASLSDGFGGTSSFGLWDAPLLAAGSQSWTYRITAGADFSGANYQAVRPLSSIADGRGSVIIGKGATALPTGTSAARSTTIPNYYQTIRTGNGDITITAGRDVQLLNSLATIYTAGSQAAALGNFDTPNLNYSAGSLGSIQTPIYPAQYSLGGGNVAIEAQNDIGHYTVSGTQLVADSSKEMPTNWLYRRDYVDPLTGQSGTTAKGDTASATWWIDYSNFFEGVGALGGGNVTLKAGHDINNVDAVVPTNARMTKGTPSTANLLELGGGDLSVIAGNNINAGVYYVQRGQGTLHAGNSIITNITRAAVGRSQAATAPISTWLPTTLFLGEGSFDVGAGGDLLLGSVANPFMLPQGINNSYFDKTYFSTYAADDSVSVHSLTGDVTLKSYADNGGAGSLAAWYGNVLIAFQNTNSFSQTQPWLRLAETRMLPSFVTASTLMPATLDVVAFSGDINIVGSITLSPSPNGTLSLFSAGSVNGLQVNAISSGVNIWGSSSINLSDASPSSIPSVANPFSFGTQAPVTDTSALAGLITAFDETGSTLGSDGVIQVKQALHAAGLLHADDAEPVYIYAGSGDISGLTLYSAKFSRIIAGNDITDVALYLQNDNADDVSVVNAGRDIILYDANSPLRQLAGTIGNQLIPYVSGISAPASGSPTAGDVQISGPGTLELIAGRNLNLGVGSNNPDGTGVGVTSIGNERNPYLPSTGADILAVAGVGSAPVFDGSNVDFTAFVAAFLDPASAGSHAVRYLPSIAAMMGLATADDAQIWAAFEQLPDDHKKLLALEIFYLVLRDTGRDHNDSTSAGFGNYNAGFQAISLLFPGNAWTGDVSLTSREVKTASGGNISMLIPGGKLTVGLQVAGTQPVDQGILTEHGGDINIFARDSVIVGTSRIFTLRGGNEIIWSSTGDIAAGASSKTVQSAPPTRVLIDPQSGDVQTDLAGLATGGGIGVLATVTGVPPGDVDLIAPAGTIDAGDAGIRVSGNLTVSAVTVLNASNIQVSGASTGTPVAPAAPNTGGITTLANANHAVTESANDFTKPPATQPNTTTDQPSDISVEVVGYGGSDDNL